LDTATLGDKDEFNLKGGGVGDKRLDEDFAYSHGGEGWVGNVTG